MTGIGAKKAGASAIGADDAPLLVGRRVRSRARTRGETRAANAARDTLATLATMVKQFGSSAYAPVEDALEAYKLARVAFVNSVNELLKDGNPGVDAALMEKDVLPLLYRPLVQGARPPSATVPAPSAGALARPLPVHRAEAPDFQNRHPARIQNRPSPSTPDHHPS